MFDIIKMLVIGIVTGIFSGIFGVGGGIILIPILIFFFKYPAHTASGTSLVALLLPVGLLGVLEYYRAGRIGSEQIRVGLTISVGLFFGTYLGARATNHLSTQNLQKAFAIFLAIVAIRIWFLGSSTK